MRLLIAMMKHETNTFSPVPTPLARFRRRSTARRRSAPIAAPERGSGLISISPSMNGPRSSCRSPPAPRQARPVEDAAYEHITDTICEAVAKGGFDGIMLDLHGAMVTESLEDGEGEFLKRLRAIDPKTPIAVSLDMHANLYDAMIANATVVTGYRTYPHIDTYETAKLAGEILLRAIRGEVRPVMAWGNVPMLPHVMRQGTDDHPNKELQHRCAAMSAEGALAASLFTGFPHADITNAGLSAVVVTDGDRKLAEDLRDELLDRAWVEREAFVYKIEPLQQSVARAKAMPPHQPGEGPIVLLDHYDNCASGGTMDTTVVLAEILRQGLEDVAAFAIYDPEAVQQAIAAGVGAEVTLVDRRQDRDAGDPRRQPAADRDRHGQDDIRWAATETAGRWGAACRWIWGRAVVLDTGAVEIVLISRHVEPSDLNCLLEPRHRPDAEALCDAEEPHPLARRARCNGQSRRRMRRCRRVHLRLRPAEFKKVRRPIYPLDLPNR